MAGRIRLAAHVALQLNHLVERGHTRIAVVLPEAEHPRAETRLGFAREVLPLTTSRRRNRGPRRRTGRLCEALARFRAQPPEVTALAAFDENTELRALAAINDLGLRCPEDLAVIGFDAMDIGSLVTPALTTVHIDAEGHGRLAARVALGLSTVDLARNHAHVAVRESTCGCAAPDSWGHDANHAPCGRLHRSPYGARSAPHVRASASPGTFSPVPGRQLAGRLGAVVTSFSSFGGIPSP